MDKVNRPGGALDARTAQPVPGLVQRKSRKRKLLNCDWRRELGRCGTSMPCCDPNEFHGRVLAQGARQLDGSNRGPSGNAVPALLEGERYAGHGPDSPRTAAYDARMHLASVLLSAQWSLIQQTERIDARPRAGQ